MSGQYQSPVIRALRYARQEVQFSRVLAAICEDPHVARVFSSAVIERAQRGNAIARTKVAQIPTTVACEGEPWLHARTSLQKALKSAAGHVELRFSAPGWRMAVEIKIDARVTEEQIDRYLDWGPVALIARNRGSVAALDRFAGHPNWVGVASWESLLPDLRELCPADEQWLALLAVMEADGDFTPTRRSVHLNMPQREAQAALLKAMSEPLRYFVQEMLRARYPRFASDICLAVSPVYKSDPWSYVRLINSDGDRLFAVSVGYLLSRHPRVAIACAMTDPEEADERMRAAGYEPEGNEYVCERPDERLRGASAVTPVDALACFVEPILAAIGDAGLFDRYFLHQL
ncbi:MAG: hypothetical protein ACLP01_25725 [Solirubrobacteraceae bacterium]